MAAVRTPASGKKGAAAKAGSSGSAPASCLHDAVMEPPPPPSPPPPLGTGAGPRGLVSSPRLDDARNRVVLFKEAVWVPLENVSMSSKTPVG
eukprot:3769748-Pyramimonas_sp.AAC.1